MTYEQKLLEAKALLEPHRKLAACERAAGKSTEMMVNLDSAAYIIADLLMVNEEKSAR